MTTIRNLRCIGIGVALCMSAGTSTFAAEIEATLATSNWVHQELQETKAAKKYRGGRKYIPSDWIFPTQSDSNGAAFVCAGKKLSLIVALKSQDMSKLFDGTEKGRAIKRPVSLYINGEEVDRSSWLLRPSKGLATAPNQRIIRKVYNATIRGDEVAVSRKSGKQMTDISLPTVNGAFAKFGGPCGIGQNKK